MSKRSRGSGRLLLAAGVMAIALAVFAAVYSSEGGWGASQQGSCLLDEVRTYLVEEAKAGSRSITVADPTGFNVGDCIDIRDADPSAWEGGAIVDIAGNVFYFETPLRHLHPPFTPVVRWDMPCPTVTPWPTPQATLTPEATPTPTPTPQATLPPEITPTPIPTPEVTPSLTPQGTPTPPPGATLTPVATPRVLPPTGMGQKGDGGRSTAAQGLLALGGVAALASAAALAWRWPRRTG